MKSHGHLRRLYLKRREQFFGDSIPDDVPVGFDADLTMKVMGLCTYTIEADGSRGFRISINPMLRPWPKVYEQVLLHEMAHVKLYPYAQHGKKFKQEIHRLMDAGAFDRLI